MGIFADQLCEESAQIQEHKKEELRSKIPTSSGE